LDRSTRLRDDEQDSDGSEGYDLGPFPEEYPPAAVAGKDVVFVTTNGTQTIANAAPAERALLGCLRNTPAVARCSQALETDPIYPICADGRFALDDFFGAATILSCIDAQGWRLNDAAWMALDFMERHRNVAEIPRLGRMGRWFTWRRMETFVFVAAVGASDLVPEAKEGQILVADQAASDGPRELTS
jgi:2-phosphosulfolactate phosphatase